MESTNIAIAASLGFLWLSIVILAPLLSSSSKSQTNPKLSAASETPKNPHRTLCLSDEFVDSSVGSTHQGRMMTSEQV